MLICLEINRTFFINCITYSFVLTTVIMPGDIFFPLISNPCNTRSVSTMVEKLIRTNPRLILQCLPQSSSTGFFLFCSFLHGLIKTTWLVHLSESSSERYSLPRHIRPICSGTAAGVPSAHCQALCSDVRRRHRHSVVATVSRES